MKTKEMNVIISQCEPLAKVIFETSEKAERSLEMYYKNLKKLNGIHKFLKEKISSRAAKKRKNKIFLF